VISVISGKVLTFPITAITGSPEGPVLAGWGSITGDCGDLSFPPLPPFPPRFKGFGVFRTKSVEISVLRAISAVGF
jgi:hypothetical protein